MAQVVDVADRCTSGLPLAANHDSPTDVAILARVLGNEHGHLPVTTARYYLTLEFSADDKARMHDLAVRNQDGVISKADKRELLAYAKAGSLLSILKSRARRALGVKLKKRST